MIMGIEEVQSVMETVDQVHNPPSDAHADADTHTDTHTQPTNDTQQHTHTQADADTHVSDSARGSVTHTHNDSWYLRSTHSEYTPFACSVSAFWAPTSPAHDSHTPGDACNRYCCNGVYVSVVDESLADTAHTRAGASVGAGKEKESDAKPGLVDNVIGFFTGKGESEGVVGGSERVVDVGTAGGRTHAITKVSGDEGVKKKNTTQSNENDTSGSVRQSRGASTAAAGTDNDPHTAHGGGSILSKGQQEGEKGVDNDSDERMETAIAPGDGMSEKAVDGGVEGACVCV
jgi:hypothetical protein